MASHESPDDMYLPVTQRSRDAAGTDTVSALAGIKIDTSYLQASTAVTNMATPYVSGWSGTTVTEQVRSIA